MRNVECGIFGTGKEVLSSELKVTGKGGKGATSKEVLSSAFCVKNFGLESDGNRGGFAPYPSPVPSCPSCPSCGDFDSRFSRQSR